MQAPAAVEENPKLLVFGEDLPRVEAAYHDACAAWDAMWREWNPKWPLAPEPCVSEHGGWSDEIERDLTGSGPPPACVRPAMMRRHWHRNGRMQPPRAL